MNLLRKKYSKRVKAYMNYLCFGKPHRLKSDERKEERKRGTKYERKSLKSGKEERIGTEKSEEQKRGTKEERKSLRKEKEERNRNGKVWRTEKRKAKEERKRARRRRRKKWTAFVLSHRTGHRMGGTGAGSGHRWPSSPIGTVSCTAFVLSHRTGQVSGRKEGKERKGPRGKSNNLHTDGGEKQ